MSESFVEVSAEVEVARALAACRAQLLDVDHYIRSHVHTGVRYGWIDPETRQFGTAQSVLGLEQHDVWTIAPDDEDAGAIVQRSDPQRGSGAVLIYRLSEVEGATDRTRLVLDARYPSSTLRRLLGPLWKLGLHKLLQRQLEEKRRAMEGAYKGGASGNLEAAFRLVHGEDQKATRDVEVARAIVTAACLAAAADGMTDGAEQDVLSRLTQSLGYPQELDGAWLQKAFDETMALSQTEAMGHVAGLAGSVLKNLGAAREGLVAAAIVAQCSTGVALSELAVLERLATSGGLDETAVQEVLLEVDQALSE